MGQLLPGLQGSVQGLFSDLLSGSKSVGEALKGFLSSIVSQLSDMASKFISSELFGFLTGKGSKGTNALAGAMPDQGGGGILGMFGGLLGGGGGIGSLLGGIFGGGGGAATDLVGGGLGSALSFFGMADGGVVAPNSMGELRKSDSAIGRALRREGSNSVIAALTPGERILTVNENKAFEKMRLDRMISGEVPGFRNGGVVGGINTPKFDMSTKKSSSLSIPIALNIGDNNGDLDPIAIKSGVEKIITDFAIRESRPNGLLHRR